MFRKVVIVACLAALLVALSGASAVYGQFDQVYVGKGTPTRGTIIGMTRDEVTLEMSGVPRQIQVNEILRISYADEPSELNNARNATIQKNWTLADSELKKIDPATLTRDYMKQDVEFFKALCQAKLALTEGGDKNAATGAMRTFAGTGANNFHFYEAAEVLGDLAFASGAFDQAVVFYGPVSKAPWGDHQMKGLNAIGRANLARKQVEPAMQAFDAALAIELMSPEANQLKQLATIGKAQALAESGKPDEGIAMLQEIIAKNDAQDVVLFARTYNALGNCYLKASKPKDALHAFLFTDILFNADAESHAEALYRLSKLWGEVNKQNYATQASTTLKSQYAGSYWASLE